MMSKPSAGTGEAGMEIATVPALAVVTETCNGNSDVAPVEPESVVTVPPAATVCEIEVYVQSASQPSPGVTLPSSQASAAVRTPLPHPVGLQVESHPSLLTTLPSSQLSPLVTTPLPQPVAVQFVSHPSPLMTLPSSQL